MRKALATFALLALAGCHTLRGDMIHTAELAEARGDVVNAALSYQQACALDRSDTDVCAKASSTAAQALAKLEADTKASLGRRDAPGAVSSLVLAYRLSQAPEVLALFEQTGALQSELCGTPASELDPAVLRVRCLERFAKQIPVPSYAARIAQARADAAALSQKLAEADAQNGRPGASYSLYSLARCLSADPRFSEGRGAQQAAFLQRTRFPLALAISDPSLGLGAAAICPQLQLPQAMQCEPGSTSAAAFRVDLAVQTAPVRHTSQSTVRDLTYVSGTETYDNPDYGPAQHAVERAQRSADRSAEQYRLAKADCDASDAALSRANLCFNCGERTRRDRDCGRSEALRQSAQQASSELDDAVNQANQTPATLTRDVYDTFRYTETDHRWALPYDAHFTAAGAQPADFHDAAELDFSGVEHVGFEPGGLAPAPRRDPGRDQYASALAERVVAHLQQLAQAEVTARVNATRAQCGSAGADWTSAWLDCQSAAAYLAGQDPGNALIDELARRQSADVQAASLPRLECAR